VLPGPVETASRGGGVGDDILQVILHEPRAADGVVAVGYRAGMVEVLWAAFGRLHVAGQVAVAAAVVAACLVALHRLLNWLTRDRPKDYTLRGSASAGNALLELHSLLEPDRRHLLEARLEERVEEERSGDPPAPGTAMRPGSGTPS
jgi:hypothetical protein